MCAGALYWSQISKIVYGARDKDRGCINLKTKLHPKTIITGGVLEEEASLILKKFFVEKMIPANGSCCVSPMRIEFLSKFKHIISNIT